MPDVNFAEFKTEGDLAFPVENKEKENSSDSQPVEDKKETDGQQTQSQEGDSNSGVKKDETVDNFANHPRWKERENDWTERFNQQEKRHLEEITKLRTEFESKYAPKVTEDTNTTDDTKTNSEIPEWFGGDDNQWKQFTDFVKKDLLSQLKQEGVPEILKELDSRQQQTKEAEKKATEFLNTEVQFIETDKTLNPQGLKVDRNKLFKTVLDNKLIDPETGNWNYRLGWKILQAESLSSSKTTNSGLDEKKKLASASVGNNRGEERTENYMTASDFEKPGARPW